MMKSFLFLLLLSSISVSAQLKIKKAIVEGQGTPLLFLAGGTGDMAGLSIPAKELSENYKVIRMEHLNTRFAAEGLTLPLNYSVHTESKAIRFTLDSLGIIEPVILAGSSYGGVIAMDFALRYPRRVKSLILMEPPVFGMALAKKEWPEGMQKMLDLTKELTPGAEITESQVERFRCLLMNCDSISVRQLPQWKTWVKQKDRLRGLSAVLSYRPDLKKIRHFRKPVLIITGTKTVPLHKRINELLAAEFPLSKAVYIESGHAIPSTAPKELVKIMREFLE